MDLLQQYFILLILFLKTNAEEFLQPIQTIANLQETAAIQIEHDCENHNDVKCRNFNAEECLELNVCKESYVCNGRTGKPPKELPFDEWTIENSSPGCRVTSEKPEPPPLTLFLQDQAKTLIVNGSAKLVPPCYLSRRTIIGDYFTLILWLKAACSNCTVLELIRPTSSEENIHVIVKSNKLCVLVSCVTIVSNSWTFLAIRFVAGVTQVFIGDEELNLQTLDTVNNVYIGSKYSIPPTSDVFQIYSVYFYSDTLEKSEIMQYQSGLPQFTNTLDNCFCPKEFPEKSPSNDSVCTWRGKSLPRYNSTFSYHSLESAISHQEISWASAYTGSLKIIFNLTTPYKIDVIKIKFKEKTPSNASVIFLKEKNSRNQKHLECSKRSKNCEYALKSLGSNTNRRTYEQQVAEALELSFYRANTTDVGSFVITGVIISGRCDCHGNSEDCIQSDNDLGYKCTCEANSNTEGDVCNKCMLNYYRSALQFSCSPCVCNKDGVLNVTNHCHQETGQCICKKNVVGKQCDECASWTHSLSASNTNGCIDCLCYNAGTARCTTTGECVCKQNTKPPICDQCSENFFGLELPSGCQPCLCDAAGTKATNNTCNQTTGACLCKTNVQGFSCNECKAGFYQLRVDNPLGCIACLCDKIGSNDSSCSTDEGQCLCRDGQITDRTCSPIIESIDPNLGPLAGGTLVTVQGKLLGTQTFLKPSVFIGEAPQTVLKHNDTCIVFETANQTSVSSAPIVLSWSARNKTISFEKRVFHYKENPVHDPSKKMNVRTFKSGGCLVFVYGQHLKYVAYPKLQVSLSQPLQVPQKSVYESCSIINNLISCRTPNLEKLYTSTKNKFHMSAILDGVTFDDIGEIYVVPDFSARNLGKVKFQYPFEDSITVKGRGFQSACSDDEIKVKIGSVLCTIVEVSDNSIKCKPPRSEAASQKSHKIYLEIGNIRKIVGTLEYLSFFETTGFIIIASSICGVVLLITVLVIISCCRRRLKSKTPRTITSDKNLTSSKDTVDTHAFTVYSELAPHEDSEMISFSNEAYAENNVNERSDNLIKLETVIREPKRPFISLELDTSIEQFISLVEPELRDPTKQSCIGQSCFAIDCNSIKQGYKAKLVYGTLARNGPTHKNIVVKSLLQPYKEFLYQDEKKEPLPNILYITLSECLRLRQCSHPNVLSLLAIGVDTHRFHLLYAIKSHTTLKDFVSDKEKELNTVQLLKFGHQVSKGLEFLALKDITHKDIAARNCIVDENVIRITDAAFSWDFYNKEYIYDVEKQRYLPVRWMAPESLSDGYYDMSTDVWSLAILIWELLTRGCLPYHEVSSENVQEYIKQGYILGKPQTLTDDIYQFLCRCWSHDNEARPSISLILAELHSMLESTKA